MISLGPDQTEQAAMRPAVETRPDPHKLARWLCGMVVVTLALSACSREGMRIDEAQSHVVVGEMLRARGDLEGAIAEYREAIQISPTTANAYYRLGRAFHTQGRLDEAIQHYQEALRHDPHIDPRTHDFFRHPFPIPRFQAIVHNALGNALSDQGQL